jgi:hypothetical protein
VRVTYFLEFRITFQRTSMIILPNISLNVSLGIFLAASLIAANGMASSA